MHLGKDITVMSSAAKESGDAAGQRAAEVYETSLGLKWLADLERRPAVCQN